MEMKGTQRQFNPATPGCRATQAGLCKGSRSMVFWYFCFSCSSFLLPFSSTLLSRRNTTKLLVSLGVSWLFPWPSWLSWVFAAKPVIPTPICSASTSAARFSQGTAQAASMRDGIHSTSPQCTWKAVLLPSRQLKLQSSESAGPGTNSAAPR